MYLPRFVLPELLDRLPNDDPDLPDDMLPNPEARRLAIEVFQTVYDALQQASQRHFDAVCDAWFQSGAAVKSRADDASL